MNGNALTMSRARTETAAMMRPIDATNTISHTMATGNSTTWTARLPVIAAVTTAATTGTASEGMLASNEAKGRARRGQAVQRTRVKLLTMALTATISDACRKDHTPRPASTKTA